MTALNLFKKSQDKAPSKSTKPKTKAPAKAEVSVSEKVPAVTFTGAASNILKQIHVSEKASRLATMNKYTFRVAKSANKKEIKKHVEQMFNVKVESVSVINIPSKKRNIGRYVGIKSGYRKAIVSLMEGYTINEAKA